MAMMTPLALKTDFGDQCFTPFANLFSPKTFSLSSPLATNLFEDLAVKDGNLCFDSLDFAGPTPTRKRKFDCLGPSDLSNFGENGLLVPKLTLTPLTEPGVDRAAAQIGQMRQMESDIEKLNQDIAELEASVASAERQSVEVQEENRDLWATLSYLQRCLRIGHEARKASLGTCVSPGTGRGAGGTRRRTASQLRRSRLGDERQAPTVSIPNLAGGASFVASRAGPAPFPLSIPSPSACVGAGDFASLGSAVLSPGSEELFAAACNMFISPGKLFYTPDTGGAQGLGSSAQSLGKASGGGALAQNLFCVGTPGAVVLPSPVGHRRLFAEELDALVEGKGQGCALPELEDELFAGLEF